MTFTPLDKAEPALRVPVRYVKQAKPAPAPAAGAQARAPGKRARAKPDPKR